MLATDAVSSSRREKSYIRAAVVDRTRILIDVVLHNIACVPLKIWILSIEGSILTDFWDKSNV